MLERIVVEGFKSIRHLDLELKPLNILIGANGAGKTNFIALFQLLNEMLEKRLQLYTGKNGANSLLHFGSKITPQMRVSLTFSNTHPDVWHGYEAVWDATAEDTFVFANEVCWLRRNGQTIEHLGDGHRETYLSEIGSEIVRLVTFALRSWKIYHFHDTSPETRMKQTGDIDDNAMFRPDAANLAAFLYRLQQTSPAHYQRIVAVVRQVAPFFKEFNLRSSPLNPEKIRLEWQEIGSDAYFNAHSLSDGTLRFICLATLLLQPELPSVILIDEPELGLHPYALTLLANLLESAATRTQVIVATQSVPLINQFAPEHLIVVDREDKQSTFKRLSRSELAEWLDEYGLGELWEKNIIGGRPRHPEYMP